MNGRPSQLRPLRTAHEWVRERLRQAIITGTYPPGTKLVQTEIAADLGISVTPVREAMRDLVNDGLIRVDPHKAARVRELDIDDALEINEIRLVLEPLAARHAAWQATAAELEAIAEYNDATQNALTDAEWLESNRHFHLAIIEASHSERMLSILSNLRQISEFYLGALVRHSDEGFRRKSLCEHNALVDAIRAGDGDEAAKTMQNHLATNEAMRDALASADRNTAAVSASLGSR